MVAVVAATLRPFIRLDLDYADICAATNSRASRRTGFIKLVLAATIKVCGEMWTRCGEVGHA